MHINYIALHHLHVVHCTVMAKRFKLRLSIPSFRLCRSKNPFSFPKTYCLFSPISSKSLQLAYPNSPDPPPTTPTNNHHNHNPFFKPHHSSKIIPLIDDLQPNNPYKTCNSPISFDSDVASLPISPPSNLSSDETKSLFTSSTSFDDSSSTDLINYSGSKGSIKNVRAKSNKWKLGMTGTTESSSVFRRLLPPPNAVEGKVKESFAVVTKSEDPYEDFKRSMLEMILEKQMFEVRELEDLLHCFLSLNSRHHHAVIVAAFTEIWETLFP